jgi:integrase
MRRTQGIRQRHTRACPSRDGERCNCRAGYEASVWVRREGKKVRKTFASYEEARQWRTSMLKLSQDGALRAPSAVSFRTASEEWLRMAETGAIRTRSGDRYKPSALRGYEQALRLRLVPALGAHKLNDIDRADLQRLVAAWHEDGLSASSIRNTVNAIRAIYRDADLLAQGSIAINPTLGLRLPAVRGKRDRIAPPDEALQLLGALPPEDRALWATALFAGLRLGELMALRFEDVDLDQGTITVARGFDPKAGFVEPKSKAGRRRVPIAALLREYLEAHRDLTGRRNGLVFGRSDDRPFQPQTVNDRARRAWAKAELDPIGLHECRHTCASFFIAAGVNAKTLSTFMGHASITTTLDRYGHLFPGSEAEAATLLDAYLARADTGSRIEQMTRDDVTPTSERALPHRR